MFQEFHRLEILMSAINIRNPFALILSIIQIEHRSDCIHTDSIYMVFLSPEQRICNQEIADLRTTIIVDQSAPMRVRTLSRILMLVHTGSVKTCHSVAVTREMSRYPVKNHGDSLLMHVVHKIHEIIRSSVTARRSIISGHLITPGCIKRMLHHRHQLHMGVSHLLYILGKSRSNLTIVVEFRTNYLLSVLINPKFLANPGTKVQFIDGHRQIL